MDTMTIWLNLGLILLFVAGNAFFVGSEIAISSARRSRIKQMAEMGDKNAKIVEKLHNEPERFYSVTQVGITLVSLGLGAVGMETISTLTDPTFVHMHEKVSIGYGMEVERLTDPARFNRLEAEFAKVTPEQLRKTAREYLRKENRTVYTVKPGAKDAPTASAQEN